MVGRRASVAPSTAPSPTSGDGMRWSCTQPPDSVVRRLPGPVSRAGSQSVNISTAGTGLNFRAVEAEVRHVKVASSLDILSELEKPGRDPRSTWESATFDEAITSIGDLKEGQVLQGVVTNVTEFGAFVDVGVHQDGLVHVSQLAPHFVKNALDVVQPGQVVRVMTVLQKAGAQSVGLITDPPDLG